MRGFTKVLGGQTETGNNFLNALGGGLQNGMVHFPKTSENSTHILPAFGPALTTGSEGDPHELFLGIIDKRSNMHDIHVVNFTCTAIHAPVILQQTSATSLYSMHSTNVNILKPLHLRYSTLAQRFKRNISSEPEQHLAVL